MSSFEEWLKKKDEPKIKGFKKRTPLKRTSDKQKKLNDRYREASKRHLQDERNQCCAICGRTRNLSIHHVSRRGQNIDSDLLTLCLSGRAIYSLFPELTPSDLEGCHAAVEANAKWARAKGYLK